MIALLRHRPDLVPSFAVGLAAMIWGLYWIPLRYVQSLGLDGLWPTLGVYVLSATCVLPLAAIRWRQLLQGGPLLLATGLLVGAAFALYGISLLLTEVVRAMLLFYVSPLWSTLLGLLILGERLTVARVTALLLGLAGLMVVLGLDQGLPLPRNVGDWLALLSGISWAVGSLLIFRAQSTALHEQSMAFIYGGLVVALLFLALPAHVIGAVPPASVIAEAFLPLGFMAAFFMLPIMYLTLYGAQRLTPARVGILLLGEVVVGVASAALLTDEPFGLREALGTALILGAAAAEVMKQQGRRAAEAMGNEPCRNS